MKLSAISVIGIASALLIGGCRTVDWHVTYEEAYNTPIWMVNNTRKPDANETIVKTPPQNMKLFLLIGQSNMAGRGTVSDSDAKPIKNCYKFNRDDKWALSTTPLHYDRDNAGYGIANTFVIRYLEDHPGETVGLITCAVGGSSSATWSPEKGNGVVGGNYHNTIRRAKLASANGDIIGLLWHQGESDRPRCEQNGGDYYPPRIAAMVEGLRKELNLENVPFVMGEIGKIPAGDWKTMNPLIREAGVMIPNCRVVKAEDIATCMPDGVHFDTPAYRTLGHRYYDAWKELAK